MMHLKTV